MNIVEYIKETRSEMAHVSWPTRRQAVIYTIVVIVISLVTGMLLGLFDSGFALAMKLFLLR